MVKLKFVAVIVGLALFGISFNTKYPLQQPWKAPALADKLVSPFLIEPLTLPLGQEIYTMYCAPCHGTVGKADGIFVKNLKVKPLNFQDKRVTEQTNGAIYWKIREGRGEMPSYNDLLSEEQKWQLVEYIRDITKPYEEQLNPLKVKH